MIAIVLLAALASPLAGGVAPATPPIVDAAPAKVAKGAPGLVAGSAVAGFVGGALFAVPAVLALLPTAGPFVAWPVALALVGSGAAFGGFLGELGSARLAPSSLVAAVCAGGALVGAFSGGLGGAALGSTTSSRGGALVGALAGAAATGIAGAALAGALGSRWLTPE